MVRIYLNTNVYCRPFDDQTQRRIRDEAQAFMVILTLINKGKLMLISSQVVDAEINMIRNPDKQRYTRAVLRLYFKVFMALDEKINSLASELSASLRLDHFDTRHISSACFGGASYFITCDDELLERRKEIERVLAKKGFKVKVINPVNFVKRVAKI